MTLPDAPPWNVLLVVHSLGPGGTERQTAELARTLDPNLFRAHVGAVFPCGMRADELRAAGIPIFEIPIRSLTNRTTIAAYRALRGYIREHQIHLVHTFDAPSNGFSALLARFFGVPIVLTSQRNYRDLIAPKYRPLIRLAHRLADGVVANCEAMRRHLESDYALPERKIHVCYNGIDTSVFHALGRIRTQRLASASLVIGAVGLLRPEKRLPLLLDAFARILPLDPAMKLAIVGDGEDLPRLEKQATALGLSEACVFQPSVPGVAAWFRSIDVFVLPSRSEAFSNALLEAMACGCCPVASSVGGNPEVVLPGQTGLLFHPEDLAGLTRHLETLIRDRELRERLAATAADHVAERFSLAASTARVEQLYRSFL